MSEVNESKFTGCMLGCAVGDALGAAYEGSFFNDVEEPEIKFTGRWTDDTHMMIGVAESLIECKGFNEEHMAWTFVRNWQKEPWRGYGPGPPKVFRMILSGVHWNEAAKRLYGGTGSLGNGAAMRIAPIATILDNAEELRKVAYKSAEITHAHELGMEGATVQAYAIAIALKASNKSFNPEDYLRDIATFSKSRVFKNELLKAIKLLDDDKRVIARELGNGFEALNSVPTAIYCFAKNHESYVRSVLYAVSLGGDADTIAAMTGAIAGAFHSENGLPRKWIERLEKVDYIRKLAKDLWKLKSSLIT